MLHEKIFEIRCSAQIIAFVAVEWNACSGVTQDGQRHPEQHEDSNAFHGTSCTWVLRRLEHRSRLIDYGAGSTRMLGGPPRRSGGVAPNSSPRC